MRPHLLLSLALLALPPAACAPARSPTGSGSCADPDVTVAAWTQDTGLGVNVCIWVDNDTGGPLWVSEWQDWDQQLCGGGPTDLTPDDPLTEGQQIDAAQSGQVLSWGMPGCQRSAATTTDGGMNEPSLVFYVTTDPSDPSCWTEVRSPRLQGWYCEG